MGMFNESLVRLAFRERLSTVSELPPPNRRSWENRTFDPPNMAISPGVDSLWIAEQLRILGESKSSTGFIEATGETLYVVHTPKGKGTELADALVQRIAEAFQAGQSLVTSTGTPVILERTERRPYREDSEGSAWLFKIVSTRWRVFTPI